MRWFRRIFLFIIVAALVSLGGCSKDRSSGARAVTPDDFAGLPGTPASATTRPTAPTASGSSSEAEQELSKLPKPVIVAAPPPVTSPTKKSKDEIYTLDAMVGQVNGKAIYVSTAFEPIFDQLTALGASQPRDLFRERAHDLIAQRVDEMVFDALILGEAERDLSEQEQQGLQMMLKKRREELVKFWGAGSETVANAHLMEKEGVTLDQKMRTVREKLVFDRYISLRLMPKINVTRKDIDRYYHDHYQEFNPPAGRVLRVIRTESESTADSVDQMLAQGTPFPTVAGSRLNKHKPDERGEIIDTSGENKVFGPDPLNDALARLKPGQHSPRIKIGDNYWWIFFESINEGKGRTLLEAQRSIEDRLRRQQLRRLEDRYKERLFIEGSYNPIDEMTDALLQVAMSRYAQPE